VAEIATRRERVVLELEDNFTTGMARAAASASLLSKELNSLSGQSVQSRGLSNVSRDMDKTGTSARKAGADIDRFSGRLGLLRDVALTIGPAFIPIGAIAVPAVTGLAAQMGVAAVAGGTLIAAFQGMGGALESVNKAALEPTADNLEAAAIAMQNLSPQAQDLVKQLQEFRPALLELRNAAGAELFPGIGTALSDLEGVLPNIERLLLNVGGAAGQLAEEFGAGISGPRGREFINFLTAEAPGALIQLGRTVGNFTAGMAELWMAFTPLNRDFSSWLLDAAQGFDKWAQGLSQTDGFQEFVAYIQETGPKVADAMGAIGNAVLQIVQAAAPLGGPVLEALTAFANVIAAIANSAAGPAIMAAATAFAVLSRSLKTIEAVKASTLFSSLTASADGANRSLTTMGKVSAAATGGLALLAGAAVGISALDKALAETLPTVEELTGRLLDLQSGQTTGIGSEFDSIAESIDRIDANNLQHAGDELIKLVTLGQVGGTRTLNNAQREIDALDSALTNLVSQGGAEKAEAAFQSLAESQGLTADQTRQLMSLLPGYRNALAGAANQAKLMGDESASGFKQAASAAQQFRAAVERLNRVLTGRASLRDYEAALDDFGAAVRKNGRSLDITTAKGRENQAALDAIAASAIQVAENMSGTNRIAFLRAARADMIDAAQKLGMTRAEAQALADKLGLVDNINARPSVTLDGVSTLMGQLASINSSLDYASRDRRTQITVAYSRVGMSTKGGIQEYDTGGFTGWGGKYEPRGIVHAGEVVIPQHLVMRDWSLLKARYGHLPGFASGGLVGAQQQRVSVSSRQMVEFAPALVDIRTPWGTQSVELIARQAARSEMSDAATFDRRLRDRD
jgi:tetratricopeptide (TPR) repeat protein